MPSFSLNNNDNSILAKIKRVQTPDGDHSSNFDANSAAPGQALLSLNKGLLDSSNLLATQNKGLADFGSSLSVVPKRLDTFSSGLDSTSKPLQNFGSSLSTVSKPLSDFGQGLAAMPNTMKDFSNSISSVSKPLQDFSSTFQNYSKGLEGLTQSHAQLSETITKQVQQMQLGTNGGMGGGNNGGGNVFQGFNNNNNSNSLNTHNYNDPNGKPKPNPSDSSSLGRKFNAGMNLARMLTAPAADAFSLYDSYNSRYTIDPALQDAERNRDNAKMKVGKELSPFHQTLDNAEAGINNSPFGGLLGLGAEALPVIGGAAQIYNAFKGGSKIAKAAKGAGSAAKSVAEVIPEAEGFGTQAAADFVPVAEEAAGAKGLGGLASKALGSIGNVLKSLAGLGGLGEGGLGGLGGAAKLGAKAGGAGLIAGATTWIVNEDLKMFTGGQKNLNSFFRPNEEGARQAGDVMGKGFEKQVASMSPEERKGASEKLGQVEDALHELQKSRPAWQMGEGGLTNDKAREDKAVAALEKSGFYSKETLDGLKGTLGVGATNELLGGLDKIKGVYDKANGGGTGGPGGDSSSTAPKGLAPGSLLALTAQTPQEQLRLQQFKNQVSDFQVDSAIEEKRGMRQFGYQKTDLARSEKYEGEDFQLNEQKLGLSRARATEDYGHNIEAIDLSINRKRTDSAIQGQRLEEDFQTGRLRLAEDSTKAMTRLTEDSTKSLTRLTEDSTKSLTRLQADVSKDLGRAGEDYSRSNTEIDRGEARGAADINKQEGRGILGILAPGLANSPMMKILQLTQDSDQARTRLKEDSSFARDGLKLNYNRRVADDKQTLDRGTTDINQNLSRGQFDINQGLDRGTTDINQTYQRGSFDLNKGYTRGTQDNQRSLQYAEQDASIAKRDAGIGYGRSLQDNSIAEMETQRNHLRNLEQFATDEQRLAQSVSDFTDDIAKSRSRFARDANGEIQGMKLEAQKPQSQGGIGANSTDAGAYYQPYTDAVNGFNYGGGSGSGSGGGLGGGSSNIGSFTGGLTGSNGRAFGGLGGGGTSNTPTIGLLGAYNFILPKNNPNGGYGLGDSFSLPKLGAPTFGNLNGATSSQSTPGGHYAANGDWLPDGHLASSGHFGGFGGMGGGQAFGTRSNRTLAPTGVSDYYGSGGGDGSNSIHNHISSLHGGGWVGPLMTGNQSRAIGTRPDPYGGGLGGGTGYTMPSLPQMPSSFGGGGYSGNRPSLGISGGGGGGNTTNNVQVTVTVNGQSRPDLAKQLQKHTNDIAEGISNVLIQAT